MTYDSFFAEREPAAARRLSDAGWANVREAYAAGASAPQLAERFGVSVSALRTRARDEGWRRADLPDSGPAPEEDEAALLADAVPPAELRPLAWARACRAVRRGRLAEAGGWTRLVRQLDALADREAASPALQARAAESLRRAAEALAASRASVARLAPAPPSPPARPRACRDPDLFEPTTDPGRVATPGPRMRGDEREGTDPHDLHGPVLPRERGRWRPPQADDGGGDADVSDEADLSPSGVAEPPPSVSRRPLPRAGEDDGNLHDLHDLHGPAPPPRGPAHRLIPPDWVRQALHAR